jgi:hypothetical protein
MRERQIGTQLVAISNLHSRDLGRIQLAASNWPNLHSHTGLHL